MLTKGDKILSVNNRRIRSMKDFQELGFQQGDNLRFHVIDQDGAESLLYGAVD